MKFWLMKSEPDDCSIDDALAAPRRTVPWTGVRNFQARNFMQKEMQLGDRVFFYHSSCPEPGIAGIAEVAMREPRICIAPTRPAHDAIIMAAAELITAAVAADGGSTLGFPITLYRGRQHNAAWPMQERHRSCAHV